ncbi:MAG: hypothetical protein WCG92_19315, partial [Hyphomicrobiales bacterium]
MVFGITPELEIFSGDAFPVVRAAISTDMDGVGSPSTNRLSGTRRMKSSGSVWAFSARMLRPKPTAARLRRDNQGENPATIRMRMR